MPQITTTLLISTARVTFLLLIVSHWAHAENRPNSQLFVAKLDGSELTQITNMPNWHFGSPEWSPDGKCIAADGLHTENFNGDSWQWSATRLFVVNPDGTDLKDIGRGAMPSWSADGRLLVCHVYRDEYRIFVLNPDGTGREGVSKRGSSPSWSPDGKKIAWISGGGLVLFDLASGGEIASLVRSQHNPGLGFCWSSGGNKVCFEDRNSDQLAVATLDKESRFRDVYRCPGKFFEGSFPSWSPDDKRIIFSGKPEEQDKLQLYIFTVGSSEPPNRLNWQSADFDYGDVDWSPDGERIVFCRDVED